MIYIFDIDGTIADTNEKDYCNATPDESIITLVNKLYDEGNKIIIFTARGTNSDKNYRMMTRKQLKKWNVQYHKLMFGKIVSDKVITPEEFLNEM